MLVIVVGGNEASIVSNSVITSHLWQQIVKVKWTENMRAYRDLPFSQWQLTVGDRNGNIEIHQWYIVVDCVVEIFITLYEDHHRRTTIVVRPENGQNQLQGDDIDDNYVDDIKERVLLTITNIKSTELNKRVIYWNEGDMLTSYSYDSVDIDDEGEHINEELLNRLELTGFPHHCLYWKETLLLSW